MIVAILAYGYDVANLDIEKARTVLLSATHAEGRMTEFSAQACWKVNQRATLSINSGSWT